MVFKIAALADRVPLDEEAHASCRVEGVVSAATSPHPNIVEMYHYCGLGMMSETMHGGDMHKVACPHYERCMEEEYDRDMPDDPWELRNDLSGRQKVQYAVDMAKAVAVLHAYPVVHNDIQLGQFLLSGDGRHLKLADFNMATIPQYDAVNDAQCKYVFPESPGNVSIQWLR